MPGKSHIALRMMFRGCCGLVALSWGLAVHRPARAQAKASPVVLDVQGTAITAEEFSRRLNFAPRLDAAKPDSERRKAMAASIIAELMFARQAERAHLDTAAAVIASAKESEKEAVYEQWMKREIGDNVAFTNEEVRGAYRRLVEQRTVDFAAFDDLAAARHVRGRLLKGEQLSSVRDSRGNPVLQSKTLSYGEALPPIEDVV